MADELDLTERLRSCLHDPCDSLTIGPIRQRVRRRRRSRLAAVGATLGMAFIVAAATMTLPPKIATVPPESGGDCPPGFAGTGPLPVEAAATIGGTPHHDQVPSVILICRYTATTSPDSTTYRYVLSGSSAITAGIARPADDLMGVTVGTSRMPGVTCLNPTQSTYLARFSFEDGAEWYATATPFSEAGGNRSISGGDSCATGTGMQ